MAVYWRDRWFLKPKHEPPTTGTQPVTEDQPQSSKTQTQVQKKPHPTYHKQNKMQTLHTLHIKPTTHTPKKAPTATKPITNTCRALAPRPSLELPFKSKTNATVHMNVPLETKTLEDSILDELTLNILNKTSVIESSSEDEGDIGLENSAEASENTLFFRELAKEVLTKPKKKEQKKTEEKKTYKARLRN